MAKKETKQKSHYFKDMKAELKKVIWPTPKQLINNTLAVIVFTLIIAVIVFVLDLCFDSINKYGVTAMQEKIQSSYQDSHKSEESSENTEATENNESNGNTENEVLDDVENNDKKESTNNDEKEKTSESTNDSDKAKSDDK